MLIKVNVGSGGNMRNILPMIGWLDGETKPLPPDSNVAAHSFRCSCSTAANGNKVLDFCTM